MFPGLTSKGFADSYCIYVRAKFVDYEQIFEK